MQGFHSYTWSNGNRYDGEWKHGEMHGKGVYTWANAANGNRYDGEFKDGKMHGKGIFSFPNGNRYEGEYKDNVRHGKGVYFFVSGDRHEGEYENKSPIDKFTFYSSTGEKGVFEVGESLGTGKAIFFRNGERIERVYEKGNLIKESETSKSKKKDIQTFKKKVHVLQTGVISFKFPRITTQFQDTDTSDFVIKSYQRSTKEFKTTKLTFIDSEDVNNPNRKEYVLFENDNTKLREFKMASKRTYIIAPFTLSNDQPLVSEKDDGEEDKLKIFLDKNQLGKYYSSFLSDGVKYKDLKIFVDDNSAVDDYIQKTFHKRKFLLAIKEEFNC